MSLDGASMACEMFQKPLFLQWKRCRGPYRGRPRWASMACEMLQKPLFLQWKSCRGPYPGRPRWASMEPRWSEIRKQVVRPDRWLNCKKKQVLTLHEQNGKQTRVQTAWAKRCWFPKQSPQVVTGPRVYSNQNIMTTHKRCRFAPTLKWEIENDWNSTWAS